MATINKFEPPFLNKEFIYKTSRSGGKGGQNVNKVSTKVQLSFSIKDSLLLSEEEKQEIINGLADKLIHESIIQITSQTARSQIENKAIAIEKMYRLINKCFVKRKSRKATRPSKSSIEKRLDSKKRNAETKAMRKHIFD